MAEKPKFKFPILMSYGLLRDRGTEAGLRRLEDFLRFANNPNIELLLDSGAFTALNAGHEIPLSEYMDFISKWGDKLFGYMALDKLGDPKQTDINLREMHRQGLRPVPVHVRGDDGAKMDELFANSDIVALGGLRRPHMGWSAPDYVKQKMEWAAGRNVHWLGYTRQQMIRGFKPFSCDSSNWGTGAMYGVAHFYHGGFRWSSYGPHDVRPFTHGEIALAKTRGFKPPWKKSSLRWDWEVGKSKDSFPFAMSAYSHVLYSRDVRRLLGTRVFLAVTPGIGCQPQTLLDFIEETA